MGTPDRSIPQHVLDKSACIVLVPGLKKGALGWGGKFGRGYVTCRAASGEGWTAPAAIRIEGGSFGFQIGFSSSDVVLLVMNESGVKHLLSSKFTLGGEATAAAGPVGRDATAQTDAMMTAEILSWSRSKGLFAGISLDGSTLRSDLDENRNMYGKQLSIREVVMANPPLAVPAGATKLMGELSKYSPRKTN
jgi:lipid-binding SYLF domain-containing protein